MRVPALTLVLLTVLPVAPAGAMEVTTGRTPADCRYETNPAPESGEVEGFLLPSDHLFRPLLADLKEPRFYAHLRRVRFRTNPVPSGNRREITAGVVGMGTNIGLWSQRRRGT